MKAPLARNAPVAQQRMSSWLADFTGYRHNVNVETIRLWLDQFAAKDRDLGARVLDCVDFVTHERVAAAFRNGLTPLLCVGEAERGGDAAEICIDQIDSALRLSEAERIPTLGSAQAEVVGRTGKRLAREIVRRHPTRGSEIIPRTGERTDTAFSGHRAHLKGGFRKRRDSLSHRQRQRWPPTFIRVFRRLFGGDVLDIEDHHLGLRHPVTEVQAAGQLDSEIFCL